MIKPKVHKPKDILQRLQEIGLFMNANTGGSLPEDYDVNQSFEDFKSGMTLSFSRTFFLNADVKVFMDVLRQTEENLNISLFK